MGLQSQLAFMLVDRDEDLERIFSAAGPLPIMAHCEDTGIINRNMALAKEGHGDDPDVCLHPLIRSEEACLRSTEMAVALARKHHARLHVAHVSTAEELELFRGGEDGSRCEVRGARCEDGSRYEVRDARCEDSSRYEVRGARIVRESKNEDGVRRKEEGEYHACDSRR